MLYKNRAVSRNAGDRRAEAQTLGNIAHVYESLGDKPKTLEYLRQALAIFREVADRVAEAQTLEGIGHVYDSLGDKIKALEFYDQASKIRQTLKP
jgi:tetratricopeptide (TPR) repeat protein